MDVSLMVGRKKSAGRLNTPDEVIKRIGPKRHSVHDLETIYDHNHWILVMRIRSCASMCFCELFL